MDRILRLPDVVETTGLSPATIYRLRAAGDFPVPVRLSAGCVGWPASAVRMWLDSRVKMPAAPGRLQRPGGVSGAML